MTPDSARDAQRVVTAATTGVTVMDHWAEVSSPAGGGGGPMAGPRPGVPAGGLVGVAVDNGDSPYPVNTVSARVPWVRHRVAHVAVIGTFGRATVTPQPAPRSSAVAPSMSVS